jgi:hypothetical protein
MAERAMLAIEPLGAWTAADDGKPRPSSYRTSGTASLDALAYEAGRLSAAIVDVELDVDAASIRADQRGLRSNRAGPRTGRVRVTLRWADGRAPLVYRTSGLASDHCAPWECSLRAIVMTLEALRAVDRHGVLAAGEQYQGSRALPAGTAMPGSDEPVRDTDWARGELLEMTGADPTTDIGSLLRMARHFASDAERRARLDKVRAVLSGQEALDEREAYEAWRRAGKPGPAQIEAGGSSGG